MAEATVENLSEGPILLGGTLVLPGETRLVVASVDILQYLDDMRKVRIHARR